MKCYFCLVLFCVANVETGDIITVEAVAGHSAELPCNVTSDDLNHELSMLLWYRNGTDIAIYSSRDLRDKARDPGDVSRRQGRYRLVQTRDMAFLQMTDVRVHDSGLYYCYADYSNGASTETFANLVVIQPPERLWVIQENGPSIGESISTANHDLGPLYVGDQLRLICVVFGGKPRPSLTWWTGGRLLKDASTPLSERRVRSLLAYGPLRPKDHGRVLTCRATNSKHVDALSIDITLDIYLPPELVSVRGPTGAVHAGDTVALQCRVLGARPPPTVIWRLEGERMSDVEQNITVEASQRLVVSDLEVAATAALDEARVTCCASAHDRNHTYTCANNFTFFVTYPPILEIGTDEELDNNTMSVVMGSNVTLTCNISANPAIDNYFWYRDNEKISDHNDTGHSIQLQATLLLDHVGEEAAGEYKCGATNAEGQNESRPLVLDVQYAPICTKEAIEEFGVGDEAIGISCDVKANPEPTGYRWVFLNGTNVTDTEDFTSEFDDTAQVLSYNRPKDVVYGTILCWGVNDVPDLDGTSGNVPCQFIITDETAPQPPRRCEAVRDDQEDVVVTCEEGHNGGLLQRFTLTTRTLQTHSEITSITNLVPKFIVNIEPKEAYEFIIVAINDKGESEAVVINAEDIIDKEIAGMAEPASAVPNITTLSLALCGGVALLALLACGLVLCAHERAASADVPRPPSAEPPLCAYNTEESNCDTWVDSDEGSECPVHRSQSFRRAAGSRHSPRHVRRSSSFNARGECRQSRRSACRVHSLQNINRRRDMDILCDHLAGYLPAETHYSYHKNPTVFYTLPRKRRHSKKLPKENSDEAQNSDGFSLPPPPDEFGSYRAGTRITAKDMPAKVPHSGLGQPGPSYAEIRTEPVREPTRQQYNNVIISPMNTVGLPTAGGAQPGLYNYPDDDSQGINTQRVSTLSTFQTNYPRESGF